MMGRVHVKDFAVDSIQKPLKRLVVEANKRLPGRSWSLEVQFWQDGDFTLKLFSAWGNYKEALLYRHSSKAFTFATEEIDGFSFFEAVE